MARAKSKSKSKSKSKKPPPPPPPEIGGDVLRSPRPLPHDPDLEDALRGAPDDPHAASVYADWLQTRGTKLGEWIALAAALEQRKDAKKQKRLDELATAIGLPPPALATWETRHGFWKTLRLHNEVDWMSPHFDATAFASRVFAAPPCAALEELRIGILRWDFNNRDVPGVVGLAGAQPWGPTLRRLFLGDCGRNIDMAHHMVGDVGKAISELPGLRWLKVHSGAWGSSLDSFGLNGLSLPRLETLIVETCAMTKLRLASLLAAQLPALTTFELWFGSPDYDSDAEARHLAKLLDGKVLATVVHLGLKNHEFGSELIDRLASSAIARRLVTLDLSMSTLDDADAERLAASADRFSALRTLDVDDNYLTADGLARLRAAFRAEVVSRGQPKLRYVEDDEDRRYASVHE